LFRRVKPVPVADDAEIEMIQIAINDASAEPYCVIFPLRFARSARFYQEQYPHIPVILLEGRHGGDDFLRIPDNDGGYFIYQTDIESDFYRAGIAAAAIDMEKNGKIIVFLDSFFQIPAKEAFLRGINSIRETHEITFLTSISQLNEDPDISCVVLAGAGAEYMEKELDFPVIFFTWLNPLLLPDVIVIVINDSPWVQSVQAVRMTAAKLPENRLKSKFQVVNDKNLDMKILRKILK